MSEYIYEYSLCHDHFGKPLNAPMLTQREEIVRCRDCKFYGKYDGEEWCEMFDFVTPMDISNKFCAWGEKKVAE